MSSTTAHFRLTKPASNENYNVSVFNSNADIIDQQMYDNQQSGAKVMVGASSSADGESGRVPQPNTGDENKVLYGDGTWKTPQSGASSVSTLTDVDLTNLSNGQILKYNETSEKWENANESGGGASSLDDLTDVETTTPTNGQVLTYDSTAQKWINANPGELTRGYTLTPLSDGTAVQGVITLDQAYTEYDEILFTWQYDNNLYIMSQKESVSGLSVGDTILLDDYGSRGITLEITSTTELTITAQSSEINVIEIRGITYSKEAKEESRDTLWTSGSWTLAHPVTDYDEIIFKYSGNKSTGMIPSDITTYGSFIILNASNDSFYWFDVTDASNFTTHQDNGLVITAIEGVKYTRKETVSITPILTEGEKIADYEINGTNGSLFAPSTSFCLKYKGEIGILGYTSLASIKEIGTYNSKTATTANLNDKPQGLTGPFTLIVSYWIGGTVTPNPVQIIIAGNGDVWQRYLLITGEIVVDWASSRVDINRLDSVINTDRNINAMLESGKFWDVSGSTAELKSHAEWSASKIIPVSEGEIYTIHANQGESHKTRIWTLCDDSLSVMHKADDNFANKMITETITIPHGSTVLIVSNYSIDQTESAYVKKKIHATGFIDLSGKKLSILGDSISAYAGTLPTGNAAYYTGNNAGVNSPLEMWWNILCTSTGLEPLVINAWSGSGITQLTDSGHSNITPMSDISRCQMLHSGAINPDIIIVAGGVNDYTYAQQASQIPGSWDGSNAPTSGNSFDETYAVMIKNIQTAYPNAIVICLSTWFTMRGTDNGYTLINGEGFTQADYNTAIEKVARIMRVPFISMDTCGFNRSNFYPTYAIDSNTIPTHPNRAGHKVMGEYLANVLPSLVKSYVG